MTTEEEIVVATVLGKPIPQGSLNPMPYRRKNGKMGVNVFQKPELLQWREKIAQEVSKVKGDVFFPKETPVEVSLLFYIARPKSSKRDYPCCKGIDIDKACRSVLDALTGVIYDDDCQVCDISAIKIYVTDPEEQGVRISVSKKYI